jgi:hypothetical protein
MLKNLSYIRHLKIPKCIKTSLRLMSTMEVGEDTKLYNTVKEGKEHYCAGFFLFVCVGDPAVKRGGRGCSGSQKVGARKIARCHFQVPVSEPAKICS